MLVEEFDFYLPEELIAQKPVEQRDTSRLLVVHKNSGALEHKHFFQLGDWIEPGDLLVFNDTRVIPARLWGRREPGGGRTEVLLLNDLDGERWEALVRPGKKVHSGQVLSFGKENGPGQTGIPRGEALLQAQVEERAAFGGRILRFNRRGEDLRRAIRALGEMPLPPYIKEKLNDQERYQTVYARHEGSAAAPTAGLHFTPDLLAKLKQQGVNNAFLTLHVGLGTFRPVKVERIEEHKMHAEFYQIGAELATAVQETKAAGKRVIAVGTTTTRALESAARDDGTILPGQGWTEIFIYPGYKFKVIDGLITNFHLPRSTLLMLVSALAGRELILSAYAEAVQRKYRFFSFGDAMLII
ncbi:MAG TPA: tRNA preQ1(34) S-adenosylmethionine ribosyltransferase-isomerase QueA [Bacillota bacterium]